MLSQNYIVNLISDILSLCRHKMEFMHKIPGVFYVVLLYNIFVTKFNTFVIINSIPITAMEAYYDKKGT